MNRHHPYGGPHDGQHSRRGGPQHGFGSDRHRGGRGRGFGRGRGGGGGAYGGGYEHNASYNQGPPQGDMGGYNNYDAGATQDPFYQNESFNAAPSQFESPGRLNQGFGGNFEDNSGFGQEGYGGRPKRFQQRREQEDKVHNSIIEERIQRERPCRTLFIRNIKYETNSDDVRRMFEEHGEIRTFFDLIANRGMVFVTYYDLRAAERARDRLQGSEISGRPIDVHYSLPRDDHGSKGSEKNQQLQGTLLVTLRNSATGQPIDDNEVRRKFQQFGDVKSVQPVGDRLDQRYVEFYDTRASEEAHDRLRHQGLQDGVMDIVFAGDGEDNRGASPRRDDRGYDRGRDWDGPHRGGRRGGRGGRGRGRGNYGGDDWDRRGGDWGRDRDNRQPYEEDYGGGRGGPRGGGFEDRFDNRTGPGFGGPTSAGPSGYGGGPPPYQAPPAAAPPVDERLEQAKKVQQLLAALKQPQGSAPSDTNPPPTAPPPMPPMPSAGPPANPYYVTPPMPPLPPQHPPFPPNGVPQPPAPSQYPSIPPQTSTPQPGPPQAAGLPNLPPNLLALLQQNGQPLPQQQSHVPPGVPQPPYNMPPQMMASPPPVPGVSNVPPSGSQQGYQQLMAYLQSQKPR